MIAHDLKPLRKCASLSVIPSLDKILHDIFWQFLKDWKLILELKENSCRKPFKSLFYFMDYYSTFQKKE